MNAYSRKLVLDWPDHWYQCELTLEHHGLPIA